MVLGLQSAAFGYSATADVTFSWATGGTDRGWTNGSVNTLSVMTDATYFSQLTGTSLTGYYNSEFASIAGCTTAVGALGGALTSTRKHGCRYTDSSSNSSFLAHPTASLANPPPDTGPGPSASGTITITDTTLTGTLTINATTDEPTGGTAASVGTGASGYNYRNSDGSPFGNAWAGVSTAGQYVLNLTGVFTASSWQITGGTARFTDTGFLCQQGGNSTPSNILCTASMQAGGYQSNGVALSWGWDVDGSGAGTAMGEIEVRNSSNVLVETLSGVLASLSIDGAGNITTNSGEVRRGLSSSACGGPFIKWNGSLMSCGTLLVADLVVTGTAATDLEDNVPGPFAFTDQGNAPLGTVVTSNPVTIGGMNIPAPISVSGAASSEYSINGGPFTSAAGTVSSGSTVRVRHTSSAFPDIAVDTVLNVGGVTDTFTSTTVRYAIDDVTETSAGVPVVIPVLQNDLAFPAPISTGIWVEPLHGTASVTGSPGPQAGISITYTPDPGYSGPDSFQYWVEGGAIADYGLVTIDVIINDTDGDGVSDPADNCPVVSNAGQQDGDDDDVGNACDNCTERANATQHDSNGDGYGNICDADLNNSGSVTAADYAIFRSRLNTTDADADLSGNGIVTALDYAIFRSYIGLPPGPSGLHP